MTKITAPIIDPTPAKGRFAPSPSGRMHLGNALTALASWLSVKSKGGKWVLRIEDLDPQRSKPEYGRWIEDDLHWLGLEWDEGGIENRGGTGPYSQSLRSDFYEAALEKLSATGLTYPCYCRRADIMATQAPHQSDGRIVYAGTCRPPRLGGHFGGCSGTRQGATRIAVDDSDIHFADLNYGAQVVNLAHECGDFIVRRADGAWAYQLAVVADDAAMGVTEVVRGSDLLASTAQQIFLYHLLGCTAPQFGHIPLLCNAEGRRLSKRDASLSLESMRKCHTAEEIAGRLGWLLGLIPTPESCTPQELLPLFDWQRIPTAHCIRL